MQGYLGMPLSFLRAYEQWRNNSKSCNDGRYSFGIFDGIWATDNP